MQLSNKTFAGDNFMGEIYRVSCQDNKNADNQTSVILKIAPKHVMRREKFRLRYLFLREIIVYDEVGSDSLFNPKFLH